MELDSRDCQVRGATILGNLIGWNVFAKLIVLWLLINRELPFWEA